MSYKITQFAKNLRTLRKFKGESQSLLAQKVFVSTDTISKYEKAERRPNEDTLSHLAKHFEISVNTLLNEEVTQEYLISRNNKVNETLLADIGNSVLIRMTSKNAESDENFISASQYLNRIFSSSIPMGIVITKCKQLFLKSFEESNLLAGAANTILTIFYEYLCKIVPEKLNQKILNNSLLRKDFELNTDEVKTQRSMLQNDFINENEEIFDNCIYALKHNSLTAELADYYMALRYIFNMIDNEETFDTNSKIGMTMMMELYKVDNQYAIYFIDSTLNLLDY